MQQIERVRRKEFTGPAKRFAAIAGLIGLTLNGQAQVLSWAGAMGAGGDDVAAAITVAGDGYVITAGYFENVVDMDPGSGEHMLTSNGMNDIYVQKLSAEGAFVWAFNIGAAGADNARAISVDPSGNIYLAGAFSGTVDLDPGAGVTELTSAGEPDILIAKYTPEGALTWARGFGGPGYEEPTAVKVGPSGNIYLLSYFSDVIDADPGVADLSITSQGGLDILLQKFNDQGDLLWAQGTGSSDTELGLSMAIDADENIWFTGSFEGTLDFDPTAGTFPLTSAGAWDIFVTKRSMNGDLLWAGRMGGLENFDTGYGIAVDGSGNAVVIGSFFSSGDFDPGAGVHTLTATSEGSDEIFLLKLDPTGNLLWAKSFGGADGDLGYGVGVKSNGNIIATGFFSGTADLDPDPTGTHVVTTSSPQNFFDSFIAEFTSDGDLLDAWQFGGASSIATQSIAIGADDAIFIAGHFENAVDLDPTLSEVIVNSNGFRDAFVIGFSGISTGVMQYLDRDAPLLFPNPATDHVLIEVDATLVGSTFSVSDAIGRAVMQGIFTSTQQRIPLDQLAEGSYQLRIDGEEIKPIGFLVIR